MTARGEGRHRPEGSRGERGDDGDRIVPRIVPRIAIRGGIVDLRTLPADRRRPAGSLGVPASRRPGSPASRRPGRGSRKPHPQPLPAPGRSGEGSRRVCPNTPPPREYRRTPSADREVASADTPPPRECSANPVRRSGSRPPPILRRRGSVGGTRPPIGKWPPPILRRRRSVGGPVSPIGKWPPPITSSCNIRMRPRARAKRRRPHPPPIARRHRQHRPRHAAQEAPAFAGPREAQGPLRRRPQDRGPDRRLPHAPVSAYAPLSDISGSPPRCGEGLGVGFRGGCPDRNALLLRSRRSAGGPPALHRSS